MTGILDRLGHPAASFPRTSFQPKTEMEYFALRLAQKLGEPAAAIHFVELSDRYSPSQLLCAYRRAEKANDPSTTLATRFHSELKGLNGKSVNGLSHPRLAAIRIERRTVVVVIFKGDQLEYPPLARQLPSDNGKALQSIAAFLDRTLQRCPFQRAVLEVVEDSQEIQRKALTDMARQLLSEQTISMWHIPKTDVIASFGYPSPRFRKGLREIASGIWPDMGGTFGAELVLDALALGLYMQMEFLLNS
jgi:hypothetical protein